MAKYPGTTIRPVRVKDELWDEAKRTAHEREESLSDVLRRALADYIAANRPPEKRRHLTAAPS